MAKPSTPVLNLQYTSTMLTTGDVFQFSGTSSISQETITNFPVAGFTVSFWVKCTGTQADAVLMSYDASVSSVANQVYLKNPGNLVVGIGASGVTEATEIAVNDNVWHHLALTVLPSSDNTSYQIQLFKDGVLGFMGLGAITDSNGTGLDTGGDLVLGQSPAIGAGSQFAGYMSEFRLWNEIESAASILTNMQKRLTENAQLILCWALQSASSSGTVSGGSFTATSGLDFLSTQLLASWASVPEATTYNLKVNSSVGYFSYVQNGITENSMVVPGIDLNQEYIAQVQAVNADGSSDWASATTTVLNLQLPTQTLSNPSDEDIELNWNAVDQAAEYQVNWYKNGSSTPDPSSGSQTATSLDISSQVSGSDSWTYSILATSLNSSSPPSIVSVFDNPTISLSYSDETLNINWAVASGTVQFFFLKVFKKVEGGADTSLFEGILSGDTFSKSISGALHEGDTYYAQIRGIGDGTIGSWVNSNDLVIYNFIAPLISSAAGDSALNEIIVNWTFDESVDSNLNYLLELWKPDGTAPFLSSPLQTATTKTYTFTSSEIIADSSFKVKIRAQDGNSYGPWSAFTTVCLGELPQVQGVTALYTTDGNIDVSWSPISGVSDYTYTVTLTGPKTITPKEDINSSLSTVTFTKAEIDGVVKDQVYNATVYAKKGSDSSCASTQTSLSTVTIGDVPVNPNPNPTKVEDPVSVADGSYSYSHIDLEVASPFPLQFVTSYDTRTPTPSENSIYTGTPMGLRWNHSFNTRIVTNTDAGELYVIWGSGQLDIYIIPSSISGAYPAKGVPTGNTLFFNSNSTYTLTTKNQQILTFNASGVLSTINSGTGNLHTLAYSGSKLQTVTDSATGRSLAFTYNGDGNISTVTDSSGRSISYSYTGGNLSTFTDTMSKNIVFTYTSDSLVETVTNQNNNLILKNGYTDQKVTKQYDGVSLSLPSSDQYYSVFSYTESTEGSIDYVTCNLTDRAGNTSTYKSVKATGTTVYENYNLADGNIRRINRTYDGFYNLLTETIYEGAEADYSEGKGNTTTYTYDGQNNILTITNPLNQVESYTYNAQNLPLTNTDVLGNTTSYVYSNNLVTSITNPLNEVTVITYKTGSINGLIETYKDFNSNTTTFSYNSTGDLTLVTTPLGNVTDISSYDALGQKLQEEIKNADGTVLKTTKYEYWDSGKIKTLKKWFAGQSEAEAFISQYTYNGINQILTEEDASNQVFTRTYNKNDQLESIEQPSFQSLSVKTQYQYDKIDHLEKINYNDTIYDQYSYDQFNRLKSFIDPMLNTYLTTYLEEVSGSGYNQDITETYPSLGEEAETTYHTNHIYDAVGKLLSVQNKGDSEPVTYAYTSRQDPNGSTKQLIVTETFPAENDGDSPYTIISIFDALNRLISQQDEASNTTSITYTTKEDSVSGTYQSIVTQTDPLGNQFVKTYDAQSRLVETLRGKDPTTESKSYTYDGLGRVIKVIENGATPVSTSYTYSYDTTKKAISVKFGKPGDDDTTSEQLYNGLSQLIAETDALGKTRSWEYAPWGIVSQYTDGKNQEFNYQFDSAARFYKTILPNGTDYIEQSLDNNGNRLTTSSNTTVQITRSFDNWNRLLSRTNAQNKSTQYDYFPNDLLQNLTYSDSKKVEYAYNGLNRLKTVTDWSNNVTSYSYLPNGQVQQSNFANNTVCKTSFNAANELSGIEYLRDTAILSSIQFTDIDPLGNRKAANVLLPMASNIPSDAQNFTYNAADQMTDYNSSVLSYDDNGSVLNLPFNSALQAVTYNEFDQVKTVGSDSYTYDDDGFRNSRTLNGSQEFFVHDVKEYQSPMYEMADVNRSLNRAMSVLNLAGTISIEPGYGENNILDLNEALDQVLEITDADGTIQYRYVYGNGLISQEDSSGNVLNYIFNANGSTLARTDSDGNLKDLYAYSPYGQVQEASSNTYNPFLFNGKYGVMDDNNGIYYMRARCYSPQMLRFMQKDYLFGSIYNPQTQNRYTYASNNPISHIDPLGLSTLRDVAIGVGVGLVGLGAIGAIGWIAGGAGAGGAGGAGAAGAGAAGAGGAGAGAGGAGAGAGGGSSIGQGFSRIARGWSRIGQGIKNLASPARRAGYELVAQEDGSIEMVKVVKLE